jgi:hypothetical protein
MYAQNKFGSRLTAHIRRGLLTHILSNNMDYFDRSDRTTGLLSTRMGKNVHDIHKVIVV